MDYDFNHLITSSEVLKDARTYGFYVREQIEAHGSLMPEWLIENLVEGAALRTDLAADYLLVNCDLRLFFDREVVLVALESITIRNMPLDSFSLLLEHLIEEGIDPTEEPE